MDGRSPSVGDVFYMVATEVRNIARYLAITQTISVRSSNGRRLNTKQNNLDMQAALEGHVMAQVRNIFRSLARLQLALQFLGYDPEDVE